MAIKGRRSTPEERLRAVQLLKEGNEAALVAIMFGVSRAIVFRWQQKYDEGGPVAPQTKKTPGPASRLSPTQVSELYAIITGCDPRQLQFDFGLWTRKIIRDLIRRQFGVKFSEVQVGRLLKKMGLSPQRPLYRAYQQDPERVAEWKKSVYPKIRKLAAEEGASIFFADEASIRTDHHAGTTWAPVGQTPVVITTGERKSVNMVSAISPRGELRFRVQEGKMNAGKFIDFLKALLDSVSGKIFLIVDGHPVHKAKKVSEFMREKADGRLSIFFLPPYSPDLNPDEWVWNNVKNDRIGRGVIISADDLKAKAIGALRRLQKLPDIVRGFLRDPKLAYILELHKRSAREVYKLIFSFWGIHLTGVAQLRALLWEGPIFAELNQRPGPMTFSYRSCSAYVNSPVFLSKW
jgi:transposase